MRTPLLWLWCCVACSAKPEAPAPAWRPGTFYASPATPNGRGLLDRRGLIHAHSIWSHDACDDEPIKDGQRDQACDADFRTGICATRQDFVMLTDHDSDFAATTLEQATLHRPERGDRLVSHEGQVTANWAACPDGSAALILAGSETGMMPVGLERHLAETEGERKHELDIVSASQAQKMRDHGAVVLLAHTEGWTADRILELGVDGFEMYNLHANVFRSVGALIGLMLQADEHPEELPHPELIFLPLFTEDPRYLSTWGSVLARGGRPTTTVGTDCHQNSFPMKLPDGERGDSYRRMMGWFSNHLLLLPGADGEFDDRSLKEALKAGRLYAVFEAMGFQEGFDFYAQAGDQVEELGGEIALSRRPVLRVRRPALRSADPGRQAPELRVRLLKAIEGGFVEVASSSEDLEWSPTEPGAYRAEVRMVPKHLREDLSSYLPDLINAELVWVYSNPIYVR